MTSNLQMAASALRMDGWFDGMVGVGGSMVGWMDVWGEGGWFDGGGRSMVGGW